MPIKDSFASSYRMELRNYSHVLELIMAEVNLGFLRPESKNAAEGGRSPAS